MNAEKELAGYLEATLFGMHKVKVARECVQDMGMNVWSANKDKNGDPMASEPRLMSHMYVHISACKEPVLLDIGANTGMFALMPSIKPDLKVYAFEPNPAVFKMLQKNVAANGLEDKVTCMPVALGDKHGTAVLKVPLDHTGLSCLGTPLRFDKFREVTVPLETVDAVAARKKIKRVDFMKIDTEGCELFVLRGAKNTIEKFKPHILLECYEQNTRQFGYSAIDLKVFIESLGYGFEMISYEDAYCIPQ